MNPDDFGSRLKFALKALNVSNSQFGAAVGADKSVMSRWLSGRSLPTGHNLSRISAEIARLRPGFTALLWDVPMAQFAEFIAPGLAGDGTAKPTVKADVVIGVPPLSFHSLDQSDRESRLNGPCYVGIHLMARLALTRRDCARGEIMRIWMDGDRMKFVSSDGFLQHAGSILLIRKQLFLIGESDTREDGMFFGVWNGIQGLRAMCLDGILTSVAMDRFNTPTSTRALIVRMADSTGDEAGDRALYDKAMSRIAPINADFRFGDHLPEPYQSAILNAPSFAEEGDFNLRAALDRGFTWSDVDPEGPSLPLPGLAQYLLG